MQNRVAYTPVSRSFTSNADYMPFTFATERPTRRNAYTIKVCQLAENENEPATRTIIYASVDD